MKHFVVTISRDYGSQGAEIGRKLAQRLGVNYYDRELVNEAARQMGVNEAVIEEIDEIKTSKSKLSFAAMDEVNLSDELIEVQSEIIRKLASKESCIIIGRCANYILKDREDCLSIYIYADREKRIDHIMTVRPELTRRKAGVLIDKMDRIRRNYYYYVTARDRGKIYEQQLMFDSSIFGVDGTAEMLEDIVRKQFAD